MQALSSPLTLCSLLLSAWAAIGFAGLLRPASVAFAGRTLFPLGALCGAALAFVAATSLTAPVEQIVLRTAATIRQHAVAAGCSTACPRRSVGRLRDGEILRCDFSWAAA